MARKKWNKQRVIKAIRERHRRGLPMTTTWNDDITLGAAAIRYFGRWHKALVAAGVVAQGEKLRRRCKWTKQGILTLAATRFFGSWHRALRSAGIADKGEAECPT